MPSKVSREEFLRRLLVAIQKIKGGSFRYCGVDFIAAVKDAGLPRHTRAYEQGPGDYPIYVAIHVGVTATTLDNKLLELEETAWEHYKKFPDETGVTGGARFEYDDRV